MTTAMTPAQLAKLPPEYLAEDRSQSLLHLCIAFIVVETIFFGIFVASRVVLKNYRGIETWCFMPLAYIFGLGCCILGILIVKRGGAGRHLAYFMIHEPDILLTSLKLTAAQEYIYAFSVAFPKLSIIALYLRVIRDKWTRRITWMLGIIVCLNLVASVITVSSICQPFEYRWDKTIPGGHCADMMGFYRFISIPNIATDIAILVLPLPTLWGLQISNFRKVGILVTFVVGGFGIITAIIRFVHFYTEDLFSDFTFVGADTETWTVVEPGAYFLCACLPGLRPILRLIEESALYSRLVSRRGYGSRSRRGTRLVAQNDGHPLEIQKSYGVTRSQHKAPSDGSDMTTSLWVEVKADRAGEV
ncbi:MAG: hypothetical protein Q9227_000730 [Pyrenula ochraceoflavens]